MNFNDIIDADPQATYTYLVEHLHSLDLAYLHVALFGAKTDYHALLRPLFDGRLDRWRTRSSCRPGVDRKRTSGCCGVRQCVPCQPGSAPKRLRLGAELNAPDKDTFYTPGAKGYIDYPTLSQA
jgi:N-ethylmaleimide reductase